MSQTNSASITGSEYIIGRCNKDVTSKAFGSSQVDTTSSCTRDIPHLFRKAGSDRARTSVTWGPDGLPKKGLAPLTRYGNPRELQSEHSPGTRRRT